MADVDIRQRIIQFDPATGTNADDHVLIDGVTAGTRKLPLSELQDVNPVELTAGEYAQLTPAQKDDPKFIYFVTDTEG